MGCTNCVASSHLDEVNLDGHILDGRLPNSLFRNLYIRTLSARNNNLEEVSRRIGDFHDLRNLNLSNNLLAGLPPEFGRLYNLQTLKLEDNRLASLPAEIRQLTKLQFLFLSRNNFSEFPAVLCKVTSLRVVELDSNCISSLPQDIDKLSAELHTLSLEKNHLACIPPKLCSLVQLKVLNLRENQLAASGFPAQFSNLANLERLDISWQKDASGACTLFELPASVCFLRQLGELSIEGNTITDLPDAFIHLSDNLIFKRDKERLRWLSPQSDKVKDIKASLQDRMERDAIPSNCLQALLLGCSKAGKTSLVETITTGENTCVAEEARTFGIEKYCWKPEGEDGIKVTFQDFAGQEDYYLTHQYFLSAGRLCIVVFDLADYECEFYPTHPSGSQGAPPKCYQKNVGNWIIASIAATSVAPVICIVAAHADRCSSNEADKDAKLQNVFDNIIHFEKRRIDVLKQQERKLTELMHKVEDPQQLSVVKERLTQLHTLLDERNRPVLPQNVEDILCVSSKDGTGVSKLKSRILSLARNSQLLPEVSRMLPGTWVDLRDRILPKQCEKKQLAGQYPYMALNELAHSIAEDDIRMTPEKVQRAVNYLHLTGSLVHHNLANPELRDEESQSNTGLDYVFLNPAWLMKFFRCIINHEPPKDPSEVQDMEIAELEFDKCTLNLRRTGLMGHKLLKALWKKDSEMLKGASTDEQERLFKVLLKLMRQFHLSFETRSGEFMPWFLPGKKPEDFTFPPNKNPNGIQMVVLFQFPTYLPIALFETFIVECKPLASFAVQGGDAPQSQWRFGAYGYRDDIQVHVLIEKRESEVTAEGQEIRLCALGRTAYCVFSLLCKLASVLDGILKSRWPGIFYYKALSKPHSIQELEFERLQPNDYETVEGNWNVWNIRRQVYVSYSNFPGDVPDHLRHCYLLMEFIKAAGAQCYSQDDEGAINIVQWINEKIETADHVIVVCSPTQCDMFRNFQSNSFSPEQETHDLGGLGKTKLEFNAIVGDYNKYPKKYVVVQMGEYAEVDCVPQFLTGVNHIKIPSSDLDIPEDPKALRTNPPHSFNKLAQWLKWSRELEGQVQASGETTLMSKEIQRQPEKKDQTQTKPSFFKIAAVHLRAVQVIDETTFIVTKNAPVTLNWKEYGFILHIPENALPTDVERCRIHVKATIQGQFQLPDNHELVSAVFWIWCHHKLSKLATMEIEHCAALTTHDKCSALTFVRCHCTQEKLPYTFKPIPDGVFSPSSCYGSIFLSHFSAFGIAFIKDLWWKEKDTNRYCAQLYCAHKGGNHWNLYFVLFRELSADMEAIKAYFSGKATLEIECIKITLEEDHITLDIPPEGFVHEGWKVLPCYVPTITKEDTHRFVGSSPMPALCELQAEWQHDQRRPCRLNHLTKIIGACPPRNYFQLTVNPSGLHSQSPAYDGPSTTASIDSKVNHPVFDQRPTMRELYRILYEQEGQELSLKIIETVSHEWRKLGSLLGIHDPVLEGYGRSATQEESCHQVFRKWCDSGSEQYPLKWKGLINVLNDAGLLILAEDLRRTLPWKK